MLLLFIIIFEYNFVWSVTCSDRHERRRFFYRQIREAEKRKLVPEGFCHACLDDLFGGENPEGKN